jgi:8-oxo-dGTP pyrophosphatase MutT (NUDIX family)
MGAGILPITLNKGVIFLLLGQERHNNLLCDFGGSSNKGEKVYNTAIREGYEELNGLLGPISELEKKVSNNLLITISYDKYTSYVFHTKYDKNLPIYFKNMNDFAEKNMPDKVNIKHNGLFEKNNIEWYKLSDFKNSKNMAKIRPHYTNILNAIVKNEKLIIKELETKKNLY